MIDTLTDITPQTFVALNRVSQRLFIRVAMLRHLEQF